MPSRLASFSKALSASSRSQLRTTLPWFHRLERALVVVVAGLLEDLEPFGVGLEHPVLDPVVDHLGEVSCASVPEISVSLLGSQGLEGWLDVLEGVGVAPDHGAVADVVAPDASRHARVEPPQARVPYLPGLATESLK